MPKYRDLSGQTFGYWRVVKFSYIRDTTHYYWECQCTLCGRNYEVRADTMTRKKSTKCRSCGSRYSKKKE